MEVKSKPYHPSSDSSSAATIERPGLAVDLTPPRQPEDFDLELTTAEIRSHADTNVRRHLFEAVRRITVLLAADLGSVLLVREGMHALRASDLIPGARVGLLDRLFPQGAVSTTQLAIALLLGLIATGCYGSGDRRRDPGRLAMAALLTASRQLWAPLWSPEWPIRVVHVSVITLVLTVVLVIDRVLVEMVVSWYKSRSRARSRALLVGEADQCRRAHERHGDNGDHAFEICGTVDINTPSAPGTLGSLRSLDHHLRAHNVDTLVVCGAIPAPAFGKIARAAIAAECQMLAVYDEPGYAGLEPRVEWRQGYPYIQFRRPGLRGTQLVLKRILDVVGSAVLLLALSPLLALVAVLVRVTSQGAAVFSQPRLGRSGKIFRCYKFRSMYTDAEERLRANDDLYRTYVRNDYKLDPSIDTRITPLGRILRKLSLDELPQLWNVLRGDMSLVGPRPIVPDEIRHYDDTHLLLLSLKPGITGAWQVSGRSELLYPERATVELDYVSNWSIASDVTILFRTIPVVLWQRGAH